MPGVSERFDELARAAADAGVSRRRLLGMAVGVAVASVLPEWLWRVDPARAGVVGIRGYCAKAPAGTCQTGYTQIPYDATCGADFVGNGKIPLPSGARSTFNGCGPASGIALLPDLFLGKEPPDNPFWLADFAAACNHHDCCYGTCTAKKSDCDFTFLQELLDACTKNPVNTVLAGITGMYCAEIAGVYYAAVAGGGAAAYNTAQQEACICCQSECTGVTCGDGMVCREDQGGQCVCEIDDWTNCGDYCTSLEVESDCGACGNACPGGSYCIGQQCVSG
jgi:hypothetical protein